MAGNLQTPDSGNKTPESIPRTRQRTPTITIDTTVACLHSDFKGLIYLELNSATDGFATAVFHAT